MLNPSTADAQHNDPTIHRCVRFAQRWGYGALDVVNLFAYRATDPKVLKTIPDPIGPENDAYLLAAATQAERIVLAWGNWGALGQRNQQVLQLFPVQSRLYCLGKTLAGQPRHPLYLSYDSQLLPWCSARFDLMER